MSCPATYHTATHATPAAHGIQLALQDLQLWYLFTLGSNASGDTTMSVDDTTGDSMTTGSTGPSMTDSTTDATGDTGMQTGRESTGRTIGFELFERTNVEDMARTAARRRPFVHATP